MELIRRLRQFPTALVLILANMIPLAGVMFFGWSCFEVVFLYWLENIVIGLVNVLKFISFGALTSIKKSRAAPWYLPFVGAIIMCIPAAFFAFHYGFFCYGHGVFVFSLLGGGPFRDTGSSSFGLIDDVWQALKGGLWFGLIALALSHGISFVYNFLFRQEYLKVDPGTLMGAPYGRIVILHVALIFGAFAIAGLGSPVFLVVFLVLLKIGLDLALHLQERVKGAISLASHLPFPGHGSNRISTD